MTRNHWFIDSETGILHDVLLCPPEHYEWIPTNDIAIATLAGGGRAEPARTKAQFDALISTLEREGVTCHFLTPTPGLPYQVYTRDSSQTTPFGTLITRLQRPERHDEIGPIEAFYGDQVWETIETGHVEGGDIHILRPDLAVIGVSGGRTDMAGANAAAALLEARGMTVRLMRFPEHFLHLDVIFAMVDDSLALAVVDVLDDADLAWFAEQGIRLLPVTYKEAMRSMACNVLALGQRRVISPAHAHRVNAMLRSEGLTVIETELDAFSCGGGSIHCMTMPLRRSPFGTA